jgi:hypothetical protein
MFKKVFFYLLLIHTILSCKTTKTTKINFVSAQIIKEGFLNCFEKDLVLNDSPVWCETSAILFDGKKILFANDKEMPGKRSSLFYWNFENGFIDTVLEASYVENPLIKNAKKFEDFARTPDGKYAFLTTGFDRIKPGSKEWDGYNIVLYWKIGDEENPMVLSVNGTDSTSISFRDKISKALISPEFPNGAPYFKIEGLAVTKDMMYWGVREEGKTFNDFRYKIKILSSPYTIVNNKVTVGDIKLFTDFNISSINPSNEQIALSSIEYDPLSNRFLILTSYENDGKLGGYLWTATLNELKENKMTLVRDEHGNVIDFHRKCEDVTIISKKKIIVIDDDDRTITKVGNQMRQPYQAGYSIVEFR